MADTDRELLEMAAKAAGWKYQPPGHIDVTRPDLDGWIDPATGDVYWRDLWNPLTDDGDALRLAVKLDMQIWRRTDGTVCGICKGIDFWETLNEPLGDDACAATRRAIVRAAAAIGGGK